MIVYRELPQVQQMLFGIWGLLVMTGALLVLVYSWSLKLERRYRIFALFLNALIFLVLQGIVDVRYNLNKRRSLTYLSKIVGGIPATMLLVILGLYTVAVICFLKKLHYKKENMLMPGAVKECLDELPEGICFFDSSGQTLLVNNQMNRLSSELTGTSLLNVKKFLEHLQRGKSNEGVIRTSPTVLVCTADNKVWDFHRNRLQISDEFIYELVAYDVTEQYRLGKELDKRNRNLEKVNERLRQYSRDLEETVREKEILDAKIHIHDNVGRTLLACRSYLSRPQVKRRRDQLLLLLRQTVTVMRNEVNSSERIDEWEQLLKASKAVDVKINCNGEIPQSGQNRKIILVAIHECLTNTVKHANGTNMWVDILTDESNISVRLSNDGRKPSGQIKETGGLLNLRNMVEAAGGRMTVDGIPEFILQIELTKGDDET